MKKIISLLLVLVLSLGMLTGISLAADKPAEVAEADAGVKVTFAGDSTAYYFQDLTRELILWACQDMPGAPTITVLKDLTIVNPNEAEGGSRYLEIPNNNADWHGGMSPDKGNKLPVTFDLGGNTISYEGAANMLAMGRWGATIKNGTMLYTGTKEARGAFVFGGSNSQVCNTSGTSVYAPELNLDNVNIITNSPKGGPILHSYLYANKINVTNSVLWSTSTAVFNVNKSTQTEIGSGVEYTGAYEPAITIKNSVIGSGAHYVMSSVDEPGIKVNVTDSVLISGHSTGNIVKDGNPAELNIAQDITEKADWSLEVAGKTLSGKAFIAGKDPYGAPELELKPLPFTDVKEADWFYSFVQELYSMNVVAGQTATTFNPNGNLTYAAALKLLVVGLTGKDAGNAASGHWATNYLNEAVTAGWTDIDAAKLDSPITREAFCEIAAKAKNLTEQPETNNFTDTTNTAVLALVKAGVINGMNDTTFQPAGILTRAQISKIISLLLKL